VDIKYLTIEQVLSIHLQILQNTQEDKELSPYMSLESALNRIDDHIYYTGLNDVYEIAALYAIAIAKGHCFNNGNKRTGMVSMIVFLFINNILLHADNRDIEEVMVDVVEDRIKQKELAEWIKANTKSP
jgi:death-on-curing protein